MIKMRGGIKAVLGLIMLLFCSWIVSAKAQNGTVGVNVGVVLDLHLTVGKMGLSCINMSLSDFYTSHPHYKTRLVLNVRDSKQDVVAAASAAVDLIKNAEVQAMMGPLSTMQTNFVVNLGENSHVPIISFTATSPSLASLRSSYFFRVAQNDAVQVDAISAIVQAFGWKEAVPIYADNEYGNGVIQFLTNSLQQADARVPYLSAISPSASDAQISVELYKLMSMQTRVFIVHMSIDLGSRLFTIAQHIGMLSEGYVWIITNGMANELTSLDASVIDAMQGVLGVKTYVPKSKRLDDFKVRWRRQFLQENYLTMVHANLNVFGLWAYDATTALAMATEKVGNNNLGFQVTNASSSNLTVLDTLGVSLNGGDLREALANTRFRGLSGDFGISKGQLQAMTFQIINVNGNAERGVGFWTSQNGLMRNLRSTNESKYSTSKKNLGHIIWPGEGQSTPKGWQIPTNGKKLRVGVPVKHGFFEFVKITNNVDTNTKKITGYCIDVFDAVVQALPYALPYELIPFAKPNGESAGTYDDLTTQVYDQYFDAVVGDITITANRSNYVDFTLPYTESGVSMVVPIKDNRKKSAWVFLKPLTWDLWVMTACSFVFIGFVVWVLEHRINNDFRGPPSHQIGTSFWFSFSTMVFAHRERVVSNLARFVVIIWVFVVLILTQSYTASLTSMLTVEQLKPTVTNVYELKKNKLSVGYQEGSFVRGILKGLGFEEFQLKPYNSSEQLDELFTRGNANGGIAAAFDENAYIKILLETYCSKYTTMVEPTFKTDGLGFVFPRGSPIVADISRAILQITEDPKMEQIENAWFHNHSTCPDPSTLVSSHSLGLDSFWGLFLIAGVASFSALLIFAISFLHEHRHIWLHSNANTSIWSRIGILLRIFDQKDLSSHTFRKSEVPVKSEMSSTHHHGHGSSPVEDSPSTTHCPPTPSSHTESNFSFYGDQGMPSEDNIQVSSHDVEEATIDLTVLPARTTDPTRVSASAAVGYTDRHPQL